MSTIQGKRHLGPASALTAIGLAGAAFLLGGCAGKAPPVEQILCRFSEDSVPEFRFSELIEAAKLARDAYWDSAHNAALYADRYAMELIPLPGSAGQVLFLKDTAAKRQIIAIRGTEIKEARSVLTDAQYTKQLDPKLGVFVHVGFGKAARELYDSLSPRLDKSYSTRITGHSLGGALAVLLTYTMTVDGFSLERTVTFGQPKVTNREGVEKFKDVRLLRVVNEKDPVAFVPPLSFVTALNAPYQHAGGALMLRDSAFTYVCSEASNLTFATEFWSDIVGMEQGAAAALYGNLPSHRDKHYIQKLEALERGPGQGG